MDTQQFVLVPGPSGALQQHQPGNPAAAVNRRLGALKVRTGCRLCKASHVKCDEQQPACGRCQRRRTPCEYPLDRQQVPPRPRREDDRDHRDHHHHPQPPHVRRSKQQQQPVLRPILPAGRAGVLGTTTTPRRLVEPFCTSMKPWDVQYFDMFRHRVALHLRYGHAELWRRTVMREAARDECVHSAILALGALARAQEELGGAASRIPLIKTRWMGASGAGHSSPASLESRSSSSSTRATTPANKTRTTTTAKLAAKAAAPAPTVASMSKHDHYYHALVHYTRAIGKFRTLIARLAREPGAGRTILIATALLVSFESLQGNTAAADQLGAHSISLLRENIAHGSLSSSGNPHGTEAIAEAGPSSNNNYSTTYHRHGGAGGGTRSSTSLIAAPLDDEGVADAEAVLVRNTLFGTALSPFYPKGREVLFGLPIPRSGGPEPPRADASVEEFSRLWDQCVSLSGMWYLRMQMAVLMAENSGGPAGSSSSGGGGVGSGTAESELWVKHYQERCEVRRVVGAWQQAVRERLMLTAPVPAAPAKTMSENRVVGDNDPVRSGEKCTAAATEPAISETGHGRLPDWDSHTTAAREAKRREAHAFYKDLAIRIHVVYYSICTVFDVSGKAWDNYQTAMANLLTQAEAVVLASVESTRGSRKSSSPPSASSTPSPPSTIPFSSSSSSSSLRSTPQASSPASSASSSSPPLPSPSARLSPLRDSAFVGEQGAIPVLAQIAQGTQNSKVRARAMELWGQLVHPYSHWDVQATYLATMAVTQAEEAHRWPPVTGDIPLEKQYFWTGGDWSEDYREFKVRLTPKVPGGAGGGEKIVTMAAVT
ncbi:uncharacterized protein B0I36DRAFT_366388 [Microdochium trichocladiopsis]|uniref:Zn(2)-C6 fungal-type domain-containing protein n=1 Tax=Microdochium trichocladiopsis TaxID=1682393 RepID=A0A9P8Y086_9PEZI|nr:uncharacterized protein B0I36DRAFT_366388 [Microdochium trichocladiopsis]KAH7024442.1 hypothetical protein B0I36DRAFT_366388 [Microdochium trichocladiopsis]